MTTPLPAPAGVRWRARRLLTAPVLLGLMTFAVAIVLVGISHPRRIGDGHEYLAMARSISRLELPIYTDAQIEAELASQLDLIGYRHARFSTRAYLDDGRFVLPHFFAYPALAAPFLPLTEALGIHPHYAFALLGALLLALAAAALATRLGPFWPLLIVASPIVWWVDKAHTELFTLALLSIALALFPRRPWWALVAVGLAATQNLPIGAGIPLLGLAALARDRTLLRDARLYAGAAAGVAIAASNPLFYLVTIGHVTPIEPVEGLRYQVPPVEDLAMFILDLNFGLLNAAPFFVVAIAALLVIRLRGGGIRRPDPELLAVGAFALLMLVSFNQTKNLNSGGTHDVARYTMWLIPLAVPLIARIPRLGLQARRAFAVLAIVSAGYSLVSFGPWQDERYKFPTAAAAFAWEHLPWLDRPVPEVFWERLAHVEGKVSGPIAGPGCAKVLVVSGGWPEGCGEAPTLPVECLAPGSLCFADRWAGDWTVGPARSR